MAVPTTHSKMLRIDARGDIAVAQQDIAVADVLVAGNHPQRAGLAAAARAEKAAVARRGNAERDRVDRHGLLVAFGERDQFNVEARFRPGALGRPGLQRFHPWAPNAALAPVRRFWMWKMRHNAKPMTRNDRSEEHTSELQSPHVISYAVF